MKRIFAVVLVIAAIIIAGCGGGGGNGSSTNPTPTPIVPSDPPAGPITFDVPAGAEATKVVGTLTVNVPPETFPSGATVTVSQTVPESEDRPPNEEIVCNGVEIVSSKLPSASITITAAGLKPETRGAEHLVYLLMKKKGSLWTKIADSPLGKFVISKSEFVLDGTSSRASLIIGKVMVVDPSDEASLWQIGSDDMAAPEEKVMVLVHGFNDHAESLEPLAQFLANQHLYRRIYSFRYDWRQGCIASAQKLGAQLDSLKDQKKSIRILAHSMGVVVSRYALEKLGKTMYVTDLYAISGANLGSIWATPGEFLLAMQNDYLNRVGGDHLPNGFPIGEIRSVEDLVPGSAFLSELNDAGSIGQTGHVNYGLVASKADMVVGYDSASAKGVPLKTLTAGTVICYGLESFSHSDLVKTPDGIRHMLEATDTLVFYTPVKITIVPPVLRSTGDGWEYTLNIENLDTTDAYITDIRIDTYDRFGQWVGINWLDGVTKPGDLYPNKIFAWSKFILRPGEKTTFGMHTWHDRFKTPLDSVADNLKACTVCFTMRFNNGSGDYSYRTVGIFNSTVGVDMPPLRSATRSGEPEQGTTGRSLMW